MSSLRASSWFVSLTSFGIDKCWSDRANLVLNVECGCDVVWFFCE